MPNVKKNNYQLKFLCVIFTISFLLLSSSTVYCAVKYYYYLQVGSFRKAQDAKHLAKKLRKLNENTIIRGEKISDLGFRYLVYLGPFSSWQGANSKLLELTMKGLFFEHTIIHKKKSPIQSNLKEKPEIAKKRAKPTPRKGVGKVPVTKKLHKGHGRNMRRRNLALGVKHTYLQGGQGL